MAGIPYFSMYGSKYLTKIMLMIAKLKEMEIIAAYES